MNLRERFAALAGRHVIPTLRRPAGGVLPAPTPGGRLAHGSVEWDLTPTAVRPDPSMTETLRQLDADYLVELSPPWIPTEDNPTLTVRHDLGTTDVLVRCYITLPGLPGERPRLDPVGYAFATTLDEDSLEVLPPAGVTGVTVKRIPPPPTP